MLSLIFSNVMCDSKKLLIDEENTLVVDFVTCSDCLNIMHRRVVNQDEAQDNAIGYFVDYKDLFKEYKIPSNGEIAVDYSGTLWVRNDNNQLFAMPRLKSEWVLMDYSWESVFTKFGAMYGLASWIVPIIPK